MVLTLGLLFVALNTLWITLIMLYLRLTNSGVKQYGNSEIMHAVTNTLITYLITCINSSVNPIVYITRNEEMNSYVKLTFCKVRNVICTTCPPDCHQANLDPNSCATVVSSADVMSA